MSSPEVCVLKTDGINCDAEMMHAFEAVGARPELVHVNQLKDGHRQLGRYGVLALPGGFSYGDDIVSGKVLATEITSYLSDELQDFVDKGRPVIGVCNGFQVLVRSGLLPSGRVGEQEATLAQNEIGRLECRWIDLAVGRSVCRYVSPEDFEQQPIPMQTAHGEGRYLSSYDLLDRLIEDRQVVFRYSTPDLDEPSGYPANPSGSMDNVAGITDPSGVVLGLMPHPERSMSAFHPHRIRSETAKKSASIIFTNIVNYAGEI